MVIIGLRKTKRTIKVVWKNNHKEYAGSKKELVGAYPGKLHR